MIVIGSNPVTIIGQLNTILVCSSGDWGVLCTWPSINKWARRKPVRCQKQGELVEQDFIDANFGLEIPIERPDMIDAVTQSGFNYLQPRGAAVNEWFRILDFRGYNSDALAVVKPLDNSQKTQDVDSDYASVEVVFEDQGDTDAEISFSEIAANILRTRGIDITTWYVAVGLVRGGILYYHTADTRIGNASSRRQQVNFRTNEAPFNNIPIGSGVECRYYICACQNRYTTLDSKPTSNQFVALPISFGGETGTLTIVNSAADWRADISGDNGHIDSAYRYQTFESYPKYDTYRWKDTPGAEVYWPIPVDNGLVLGVTLTNHATRPKTLNPLELSAEFGTSPVNWVAQRGTGRVRPSSVYYFDARGSGIGTPVESLIVGGGETKYILLVFYDFWRNYLDAQGRQHSDGTPIPGSTGNYGVMAGLYYRDVSIANFRMNLKKV